MLKLGGILLGFSLLGACASEPPSEPVPPAVVIENIRAWDGKTVEVEGWLGLCESDGCPVYSTVSDLLASGEDNEAGYAARSRGLDVGGTLDFEPANEPLDFAYVRIVATVNDNCWPDKCAGRASELEPISVEPIFSIDEDD